MTSGKRVFAFFGADLGDASRKLLDDATNDGFALLPLDAAAIGQTYRAGVRFTLLDDWLDDDAFKRAHDTALESNRCWHRPGRHEFTWDGICWPDLDRDAMRLFWHEVQIVLELDQAFHQKGITKLVTVRTCPGQPKLAYQPADTLGPLLQSVAFGYPRARSGSIGRGTIHRLLPSFGHKLAPVLRRLRGHIPFYKPGKSLSEKIVLAFNPGEFHRLSPQLHQLELGFARRLSGVLTSPSLRRARSIGRAWKLPIFKEPPIGRSSIALSNRFLSGYHKAQAGAVGKPWEKVLHRLSFHFEYYCRKRWPLLAAQYRAWCALWRKSRPSAVLISGLSDAESQIPGAAARRFGIPTFSIPHGAVAEVSVWATDYMLYGTPIQRRCFEQSGVPAALLRACGGLVVDEYPTVDSAPLEGNGPWRVLVLVNPVGSPQGTLLPLAKPTCQMRALRALVNPPEPIRRRLTLHIKAHPHWPDLEILSAADERIGHYLLPPDSKLKVALDNADLVVALNYVGSALIHACHCKKPILLFWPNELMRTTWDVSKPFLDSGMLVRTPDELWAAVENFFTDSSFAGQLRTRAETVFRSFIDWSDYPPINEVVLQTLQESIPQQVLGKD